MNRGKLIEKVAKDTGLTKAEAARAVASVFANISEALSRGEKVSIHNFGIFEVRERKPKVTRDVSTGERRQIPGRKIAFFRSFRKLRDIVRRS